MKRVVLLLAIALCVTQAWAFNSAIVKLYRGATPGGDGHWYLSGKTSLSDLDNETIRTAAHTSGQTPDTSWEGSREPYLPFGDRVDGITGGDCSYFIRKDGAPDGFEGVLSNGYSVYLIQGKTYADVVAELGAGKLCYNDFVKNYGAYQTSETGGSAIFYGFDGTKNLEQVASTYKNGESITSLDPSTLVAVMTYLNSDGSAAQYVVVDYSKMDESNNAVFQIDLDKIAKAELSTGWTNFDSIPEPTSGMLLLIGLAGLALKRKRA